MGKNFDKALKEFKIKLDTISQDPKTGAIESKVTYLPDFEKLFHDLQGVKDDFYDVLKNSKLSPELQSKIQNDQGLINIYNSLQKIFNQYRTHLRKNYPNEYNTIKDRGLSESDSTMVTGKGEQYGTPKAFKNKRKKNETKRTKTNN
jgi:hypothetical protein